MEGQVNNLKGAKRELLSRAEVISKILDSAAIQADLDALAPAIVSFRVKTNQKLGDVLRLLYQRWPDVETVSVSDEINGRSIIVKFSEAEPWKANTP